MGERDSLGACRSDSQPSHWAGNLPLLRIGLGAAAFFVAGTMVMPKTNYSDDNIVPSNDAIVLSSNESINFVREEGGKISFSICDSGKNTCRDYERINPNLQVYKLKSISDEGGNNPVNTMNLGSINRFFGSNSL
jgi:hypothetical protein